MKPATSPVEYEIRLRKDPDLAIREIGNFETESSQVDRTLRDLCRILEDRNIPYALMGALALGRHGYVRATTDIDLLMTREGLEQFRQECVGRGYVPAFAGAIKTFRAAETGVRVEILIAGEYPGDGKPKPVAFPDPREAAVRVREVQVVNLAKLVELKLASGMTAPHRRRDLSDVQDLIRALSLSREFSEQLDGSVREIYGTLWQELQTVDPHEQGLPR